MSRQPEDALPLCYSNKRLNKENVSLFLNEAGDLMSVDTPKGLFRPPQGNKVFRNPRPAQQQREARTRKNHSWWGKETFEQIKHTQWVLQELADFITRSLLSSRRARTKSCGTTGQSISPQSPRRWWKSVWKPFSKKKVIRSHWHRILKGKSCLTSVMAFHNETASWWMREEKLLLSTWISVKFLTLSHCHHHRTTDKLKVRRVKSEMNWKLSK